MRSPSTSEETATRDLYGRTKLGQSLLMARRLVEAGVTFVTVDAGGWDTHANNFESLKSQEAPRVRPRLGRPDARHGGAA